MCASAAAASSQHFRRTHLKKIHQTQISSLLQFSAIGFFRISHFARRVKKYSSSGDIDRDLTFDSSSSFFLFFLLELCLFFLSKRSRERTLIQIYCLKDCFVSCSFRFFSLSSSCYSFVWAPAALNTVAKQTWYTYIELALGYFPEKTCKKRSSFFFFFSRCSPLISRC